ncbi:MAG: MFS transporter [Candidatus Auribacter fodinae]|uniref:MFS transporter n=1 Tax=Candidatus Auribacter fodinae TaxID=2093366 RepID=A0A3A4QX09_9BACT|nr:MAG: MFS transporter [Candidatus Auribacter fodinae]
MSFLHTKENVAFIFRSLRSRNYRFYFFGLGISFIGSWMHRIAIAWLAYRLTNSSLILGVVGFATMVPSFIVAPFAGALADSCNRHKMIMAVQLAAVALTSIMAYLIYSGMITITHILLIGSVLGVVFGVDIPLRHSFVIEIVHDRDDLPNAIALNSFLFNAARLIGPAIAGWLIKTSGEGICIVFNGVSYLIFFFALLNIKVDSKHSAAQRDSLLSYIREGFVYAYHNMPIRAILLLLSLVSLIAMPYFVLLPIFARDILKSGPETMGYLTAASGIGALCGVSFLASRKNTSGLELSVGSSAVLLSAGLMIFAFSRILSVSLVAMFIVGFGLMVHMSACNTVLQTVVDDDKRGRIMSLYTMTFMGMAPFGNLLAGWMASIIGAPLTVFLLGCVCLAGVFVYLKKLPEIRKYIVPVYAERGIEV